MILEIQHETRLEYAAPVTESVAEVRVEPVTDADQTCRSFHLVVSPPTDVYRYRDGFGNSVHHFSLLAAHSHVRVLAASVVEAHPRYRDASASSAVFPLDEGAAGLDVLDFVGFRGPVAATPLLDPLLEALRPRSGMKVGELLIEVAHYIHTHFEYAPAVTHASSPVADVLREGKGVCQDFAHLMIAVLRSFGVPARYVSGYIHRPNKESQSHAWCEAWLPDLGWLGVDPTNDRVVDEQSVKVAIGRDFTDVPPNKGVYRGNAQETIFVRVETRALERPPSLAWREQLPPLNIPLTAIPIKARAEVGGTAAAQEQQ
jgi:transglutaminase-like putative cysteine protease